VFHSPTNVWIIVTGYRTFGAGGGQFCACAFKELPSVTSVNNAAVHAQNGTLLAAFDFNQNAGSSAAASGVSAGNWQGFLASVTESVPGDLPVTLRFDATVAPKTTFAQIESEILAAGPLVITDEANSDGSFAGTHQSVVSAGNVTEGPVIPTVSGWGLIILALLVLSGGTLAVRRMTGVRPAVA